MPHVNNPSINSVYTMTLITKSRKNLLQDYKKMKVLAEDIKKMYELLDRRHHELTYITMQMENHFAELFKTVYGTKLGKYDFKSTIDRVGGDVKEDNNAYKKTFF